MNKKNKASSVKTPKILKENKFSPLAIEVVKKLKSVSKLYCVYGNIDGNDDGDTDNDGLDDGFVDGRVLGFDDGVDEGSTDGMYRISRDEVQRVWKRNELCDSSIESNREEGLTNKLNEPPSIGSKV